MISFAPYIWIWIKNLCGNLFNMNPSIVSNDWNGDSVKNYLIILYKFPGSKTAYIKLGTHGYKTFWLFLFIFVRNKILMVPKTSESQFTIIESVYIVCLSNFALYKIVQDGFVQHPIFLKDFFLHCYTGQEKNSKSSDLFFFPHQSPKNSSWFCTFVLRA